MSGIIGSELKYVVKKGSTWGTAVQGGANDGYLFSADSLKKARDSEIPEELGQSFPTDSISGEIKADGDMTALLRYGGEDLFIGMVMGSCNVYYHDETALDSGTATGGTTTSLTDTSKSWATNQFQGKYLVTRSGTGAYQVLSITSNTSDTLSFATATAPASGTTYDIYEYAPYDLGIASSGTSTTLVDTTKSWSTSGNGELAGKWIKIIEGTGVGTVRKIVSNTATAITVASSWSIDNTSKYEVSGSATRKVFDFTDSTDGLFCTIARKEGSISISEFPSCKFTSLTLSNEIGKVPTLSFKIIADRLLTTNTTNTQSSFNNVTIREQENLAVFKGQDSNNIGVYVRLNNRDGSALSSGDNVDVKNLEISYDPSYEGIYLLSGGDLTDEPSRTKIVPANIKMTFPRVTSTQIAYWNEWDSNTPKKMEVAYVGNAITSNVNRLIKIQVPNMKYSSVETPISSGIIEMPVEFSALAINTAPQGMTGVTKPFRVITINTYGGNPLQDGN